jgi:hypothetical protein
VGPPPKWVMAVQTAAPVGVAADTSSDMLMLDAGSEEHICRPDLCEQGSFGPLRRVMRDVAGRPIENYGAKELEMTVGQEDRGTESCRTTWQVGEVEKDVLSAGKLTDTGVYRVVPDSEGSGGSHTSCKPFGKTVAIVRRGITISMKASDAQAVDTVAPMAVDAMREEVEVTQPVAGSPFVAGAVPPLKEKSAAVPSNDAARPEDPAGLRAWSSVEAMRQRLRLLSAPVYGAKYQLWERLLQYEGYAKREAALHQQLVEELAARRQGGAEKERVAIPLPIPKPSTPEEVEAHELRHFPSKPWCRFCQCGKRRQAGHSSSVPEDTEKAGSLVPVDYVFLKSTGETTHLLEEAWATTFADVHVGTGVPCCTAVDEALLATRPPPQNGPRATWSRSC